jgi:cytochrome c
MSRYGMIALATMALLSPALAQEGNTSRGQRDFQACAPCHSLEPDRNMTGPSLAGLWGRKAGGLSSFDRYSDPLKSSGIIWDDRALDGWLTDPQRMVPDNAMPFEGIKDAPVRADLLAFLKEATKPGAAPQRMAQQGQMKGMGGMMGGGQDPNLKMLEPKIRSFMSAKAADRSSSHWLAIAACSVRSGRCPARRSSEAGKARVARDDGSEHIFRYLNLGKNA